MDKTKIAIEIFDKFAKVYQDKFMNLEMYHEAGYLIEALTGNGFTILDERRKTHPQYEGTTTKDLIIIAKKELLF